VVAVRAVPSLRTSKRVCIDTASNTSPNSTIIIVASGVSLVRLRGVSTVIWASAYNCWRQRGHTDVTMPCTKYRVLHRRKTSPVLQQVFACDRTTQLRMRSSEACIGCLKDRSQELLPSKLNIAIAVKGWNSGSANSPVWCSLERNNLADSKAYSITYFIANADHSIFIVGFLHRGALHLVNLSRDLNTNYQRSNNMVDVAMRLADYDK
jgi:hypothetical protein